MQWFEHCLPAAFSTCRDPFPLPETAFPAAGEGCPVVSASCFGVGEIIFGYPDNCFG